MYHDAKNNACRNMEWQIPSVPSVKVINLSDANHFINKNAVHATGHALQHKNIL